jgi:hypothetical protein
VDDVDSLHVEIDNLNNPLVGFCFIISIDILAHQMIQRFPLAIEMAFTVLPSVGPFLVRISSVVGRRSWTSRVSLLSKIIVNWIRDTPLSKANHVYMDIAVFSPLPKPHFVYLLELTRKYVESCP